MISILIPTYNRVSLLAETIGSALSQTRSDLEIVVVDNCSTDTTWDYLQQLATQHSCIRIFRNGSNFGPVRNWSRCVDEARGQYAKILWSDDIMDAHFLEKTIPLLETHADIGFVYSNYSSFTDHPKDSDAQTDFGPSGIFPTNAYILKNFTGSPTPVSPGNAVFRLDDLKKSLLVDIPNKVGSDFATHAIGNDLLIYLLTASKYPKYAVIAENLIHFRVHDGAISMTSGEKKLTLHYNLARAYFAETYRPDLIPILNSQILLSILGCKEATKYGLDSISNFYISSGRTQFDWAFLALRLLKKATSTVTHAFQFNR